MEFYRIAFLCLANFGSFIIAISRHSFGHFVGHQPIFWVINPEIVPDSSTKKIPGLMTYLMTYVNCFLKIIFFCIFLEIF